MQQTQSVNKMVSLPVGLYKSFMNQAKQVGVSSFQQYLKHVIIKSVEENKDMPLYMVDEETEKRIGEGMEDLKNGRYVVCKTIEETQKYLDELDKLNGH